MENIYRAMGDAGSFLTKAVQDSHITDEANTMLTRAKQFTEEKLGKAERTENDPFYELLSKQTDVTKGYSEKIIRDTEAVLIPNPAARLETFMFENVPVDKIGITNTRLSNLEYLGTDMIEAGNEFGAETPYGSALIRVGQTEKSLGEIEREYIRGGHTGLIAPLQNFLDDDMKNIIRSRKVLENKRLDLDASKNKVRKCRGMTIQTQKDGIDPRALLEQAESELRTAQRDYDMQVELTKKLMEGLSVVQTHHLRYLQDFVEAQCKYYAGCHQTMQELQGELNGTMTIIPGQTASLFQSSNASNNSNNPNEKSNNNNNSVLESNGPEGLQQINLSSPPPPPSAPVSRGQADFF
uniref:BAR domain-containing protein n=1 Tax=Lepeophtheirus salmonis TaxID=72036 RepID=A0A0K2UP37_LEPSM